MVQVKGNGTIVSKEFQVSSFVRLHLATKGETTLIQSDEEKVVIETDENLLDYFDVVNAGRTLYVSSEAKFRSPAFTECKIKVYLRQINVLYIRCDHGDVNTDALVLQEPLSVTIQSVGSNRLKIQAPAIKILNQSEGDVVLAGKCQRLEIKNQSEGDFLADQMIASEVVMKNMSSGNVELHADQTISIYHYGSGKIHYRGNALLKDVKYYGGGQVKHIENQITN